MRTMRKFALVSTATIVAACSRGADPAPTGLNDDLRKDLDRAAAPVSDLASLRYSPHFLSADEILPKTAPEKMKVARHRGLTHAAPIPTTQQLASVSPQPVAQADPGPSVVRIGGSEPDNIGAQSPTPGPLPSPDPAPAAGGRGSSPEGGHGSGIGGDGPVIRGGWPGDDHCAGMGPGTGIAVNTIFPGVPMGGMGGGAVMAPRGVGGSFGGHSLGGGGHVH